jgi:hypothetical protein
MARCRNPAGYVSAKKPWYFRHPKSRALLPRTPLCHVLGIGFGPSGIPGWPPFRLQIGVYAEPRFADKA